MYVSVCWLANTGASLSISPLENVTYEFDFASLAVPARLRCLTSMVCEMRGHRIIAGLCTADPRIFSLHHVAFLHNYHLDFSLCVSLVSMWCIHIVVWTVLLFGKQSRFILSDGSNFYMIDNLLIAVHAFARRILTPLSVYEMLLLRYVDWSSKFRGLPLWVRMAPSCLKHVNFYFHSRKS